MPAAQDPAIAPEWEDPVGVPISAILFGGRRASVVPLVFQSCDWQHGVFLGSIMASETTAAAAGAVGNLRRDPFAMLPFCGYNMADYFAHWLDIGAGADPEKLPKIFYVNWFRKGEDGRWLWPGYGENSRVLEWVFERVSGKGEAVETPIGFIPAPGAIDTDGLDVSDGRHGRAAPGGPRRMEGRGAARSASTSPPSATSSRRRWPTRSTSWSSSWAESAGQGSGRPVPTKLEFEPVQARRGVGR